MVINALVAAIRLVASSFGVRDFCVLPLAQVQDLMVLFLLCDKKMRLSIALFFSCSIKSSTQIGLNTIWLFSCFNFVCTAFFASF
jgi:hypothetical protein